MSAFLARNLHSFVQTLQAKNKLTNEIDLKCITWGVTNSGMLGGKADGCPQWFLSRLASEKPTARRAVGYMNLLCNLIGLIPSIVIDKNNSFGFCFYDTTETMYLI